MPESKLGYEHTLEWTRIPARYSEGGSPRRLVREAFWDVGKVVKLQAQ